MNPIQIMLNPSHIRTMFVRLLVSGLVALLLGVLLTLPALAAGSGTWTLTGSFHASRSTATATLLPNGQVLVAGGCCDGEASLASAELYNPTTGTWTVTGSVGTPRTYAEAVLLQNGQVLVAGGVEYDNFGDGFILTSAELYNPTTGTWTTTGSMNNIHSDGYTPYGSTTTLLQNGQVLVAGGCCNPSTEVGNNPIGDLYNPATGTWTTTGPMNVPRSDHIAALLPNGQVLVAGGADDQGHQITSAELYNPSTNAWSFTGSMQHVRFFQTMSLLQNGQVLVAGGQDYSPAILNSAELYTP